MSDQQRMTDERRKEIQAECWFITGRPYPDNVPSRKELMLVECEAELHRLEQAHQEFYKSLIRLVMEMNGEVKGKTPPIVHDAATFYWAERLDELLGGALTRAKD